jgi:hypothetical protein
LNGQPNAFVRVGDAPVALKLAAKDGTWAFKNRMRASRRVP